MEADWKVIPFRSGELEASMALCALCRQPLPPNHEASGAHFFRRAFESTPTPTGYYDEHFTELMCVGRGSFGAVFLCQHTVADIPLGIFAVKKIPVGATVEYLERVVREVRLLENIGHHPNVVEYHYSWLDEGCIADFGPRVRCLYILLGYASEGSLDRFLEHLASPLPTILVWHFFIGAVLGVGHLHEHGVVHRDIKPQNLLLSRRGSSLWPRVLVSDFGTATLLSELVPAHLRGGGTGTIDYMAPELTAQREGKYVGTPSMASDIWSLGVVLHVMSFGRLPMIVDGSIALNSDIASSRPIEIFEVVTALLQEDPFKRPTCAEVLRLPPVMAAAHEIDTSSELPATPVTRRLQYALT